MRVRTVTQRPARKASSAVRPDMCPLGLSLGTLLPFERSWVKSQTSGLYDSYVSKTHLWKKLLPLMVLMSLFDNS